MSIKDRAARVKLILFDVDGVLTNGTVLVHGDGTESKSFGIRDGIAMIWAQRAGLKVGFLSARISPTTPHRAAQLGVTIVQNGTSSKVEAFERIVTGEGLADTEVAYMGDDVVDLGVLGRAGLSAAPADAVAEVRQQVDWVSRANGGHGAARELIETILKAQDRWKGVVRSYADEGRSLQDTREAQGVAPRQVRNRPERRRGSKHVMRRGGASRT